MNNLVRFLLYILAAWTVLFIALVILVAVAVRLTRPVWRRIQALTDKALGEPWDDEDDSDLTALLDATQPHAGDGWNSHTRLLDWRNTDTQEIDMSQFEAQFAEEEHR